MIKQVKINERDGAEMVWIPEGTFWMGSKNIDNELVGHEKPERPVHLATYCIYKFPVTVAQYGEFCREIGFPMPPKPDWGWRHDHPVVNVSWEDAERYCDWAQVTLPTEAEWEKAARGVDGRRYPWGNAWVPQYCLCSHSNIAEAGSTGPVDARPDGVSPYGAFDMVGNVWEWCQDWYETDYYAWAPSMHPLGPERGVDRVIRGGSWGNRRELSLRCACRGRDRPTAKAVNIGFRCVSHPGC
jgi:sulfatase modifying factor 1